MQTNDRKGHIYLVYSSETAKAISSDQYNERPDVIPDDGIQLELFHSEKPDVMIFAQPLRLNFVDIQQLIEEGHITRILDLREVPYMTFGNETRERFLKVLSERQIEYYNLAKLGALIGHHIQQAQDFIENKASFVSEPIRLKLKRMIETGPTMVFSDTDPTHDNIVRQFQEGLDTANIEYSPYYTKHQ